MSDVLADEIVARDRDQMTLADIAQSMQDSRHAQRDRGLAGAGIAGEAHVQRRAVCRQAELAARPLNKQQRRDLADPALDGLQAHQLLIEIVEDRRDPGVLELQGQVDSRRPIGLIWL